MTVLVGRQELVSAWWQTIRKAADKPVIGVIDGMACSAMYEIAAACTEILLWWTR